MRRYFVYGFVEKSIVTLRDKIKNIKYPIREYDVVHFIAGEKFGVLPVKRTVK